MKKFRLPLDILQNLIYIDIKKRDIQEVRKDGNYHQGDA